MPTLLEAPHRDARNRELFMEGKCSPTIQLEPVKFEAITFEAVTANGEFLMVDDVNASLMPLNAYAAAFYVGGPFANFAAVQARLPRAILAPTMLRAFPGSLKTIPFWQHGVSWDIEPSLFTPAQAGGLVKFTRGQGVFPHIYCMLSQATLVCESIHAAGFAYEDFGLHTAHWTMQPHICGGISTPWGLKSAKSTQWTDLYLGLSLDCSLCASDYLGGGVSGFPLKQGSTGPHVVAVQKALDARGFHLVTDGQFGPNTAGAVRVWQDAANRRATGQVTHADWAFLFPTLSIRSGNKWPRATMALKRRLNAYGYHLTVDGEFGPKTDGAVKEFQRHHGLAGDGIVGPLTWTKVL